MIKAAWYSLLLLLLFTNPALALVDPFPTTQTVPDWMAVIQLRVDDKNQEYCKGALIAPQWVVSSGRCILDLNHYTQDLSPGDDLKFFIKLGVSGDVLEVENSYVSDDYSTALYRLALPSQVKPLALSTKSSTQLLGTQVTILNNQKSAAIYHGFFNPGVTAAAAICKIGGVEYTLNGAYCLVRTAVASSTTLYKSTATIIDPASANAPSTSLDKQAPVDKSGKHLSLDFRISRTYPCMEDVGLPLLVKAENGNDEIAGLVASTGIFAALEVCGPSLANEFVSASAILNFVDKTYAKYDFAAVCPSTPEPAVSYNGEAGISLQWNAVKGATGYKVHYTTRHGQVPFATVDVSTQTTINTTLAHGVDYLVAVTAYNASCTSGLSKQLAVNVDVR